MSKVAQIFFLWHAESACLETCDELQEKSLLHTLQWKMLLLILGLSMIYNDQH